MIQLNNLTLNSKNTLKYLVNDDVSLRAFRVQQQNRTPLALLIRRGWSRETQPQILPRCSEQDTPTRTTLVRGGATLTLLNGVMGEVGIWPMNFDRNGDQIYTPNVDKWS